MQNRRFGSEFMPSSVETPFHSLQIFGILSVVLCLINELGGCCDLYVGCMYGVVRWFGLVADPEITRSNPTRGDS